MLGALLLVGEELGLERGVLVGRAASYARAGERAVRHHAVAHAAEDLGARGDEDRALALQVDLVGARIHDAERPEPSLRADLNADGKVDAIDLGIVLDAW